MVNGSVRTHPVSAQRLSDWFKYSSGCKSLKLPAPPKKEKNLKNVEKKYDEDEV